MKQIKNLLLCGGDVRQLYMPEMLMAEGFDVKSYGFGEQGLKREYEFGGTLENAVSECDAVILPLPSSIDAVNINASFSKENISFSQLLEYLNPSKLLLGSMLPEAWKKLLKEKNITYYDYLEREELALLNAVPTAEGVAATLIMKLPVTIKDSRIAVTGFGRCGEAVARVLKALGAEVTAVVRSDSAAAKALVNGHNACFYEDFAATAGKFDAVVNTVPSLVIDRKILRKMKEDSPVIEIASSPFGVDFAAAQEMKIKVIKEGSIPGRTSPKTAAQIICTTIFNILKEEI